MSVYVDTSAFLAVANREDEMHEAAARAWRRLLDDEEMIVTSNYTLVETAALLQARHGVPALRTFVEAILPAVLVEWVDPAMHSAAMTAALSGSGKRSPSFVDCISFEIIHRSRIADVFEYDRHFRDRGFRLWESR